MISIWERDTFYRDTDVLIAGGGLMGLWTAFELLKRKPGLRVTIAEALPVPALASTRNAGFACFGSPSELWADWQLMGEEAMWQVVEMRYKGIGKVRKMLGDEAIGYDPSGGYEVYLKQEAWNGEALDEKLNVLNKGLSNITGIENTYKNRSSDLDRFGLSGFASMAGNGIEGGVHSGKMVNALVEKVRQAGAVFLSSHKVQAVEGFPDDFMVRLNSGGERVVDIKCRLVVWATNAFLSEKNELSESHIQPARGQVLLSPPIEGLKLHGTFHFDEGYYYFRNLDNRLLIGGARNMAFDAERTHSDLPNSIIKEHLENFIRAHLPEAAAVLNPPGWMHWAGIMGISNQKMPIVKELEPGIWAALACNGMGVALTPLVSEEVAQNVLACLS